MSCPVEEQHDPGRGAHAADADDLPGEMSPRGTGRAGAAGPPAACGGRSAGSRGAAARDAPRRRCARADPRSARPAAGRGRSAVPRRRVAELLERLEAVVRARLRGRVPHGRRAFGVQQRAEAREQVLHVQVRVPDVEHRHAGQLAHRLAVRPHGPAHRSGAFMVGEAVVAAGDLDARGQALDVPLPRPGVTLVEVVEAEEQVALRRPEDPEVRRGARRRTAGPSGRRSASSRGPPPSAAPRRGSRRTARPASGRDGSARARRSGSAPCCFEQVDRISPGRLAAPDPVRRARRLAAGLQPTRYARACERTG